ncbi:hypothetical protein CEF21_01260 [Bacillus sp. FJAT-42376]|nr:hypothetical protein CEF21_01260 [Bacillus sp. FJAT-42376]
MRQHRSMRLPLQPYWRILFFKKNKDTYGHAKTLYQVLHEADKALYASKEAGRNRVSSFSGEPVSSK